MPRHEFSQKVKREAVKRAAGRCEAVGEVYGLAPGQRCNADLGRGFEIDHYPIPATDEGSDVLSNAVCCCIACHRAKTSAYDVPMQAKAKRVSDKHLGIERKGRGFSNAHPQRRATSPVNKWRGWARTSTREIDDADMSERD